MDRNWEKVEDLKSKITAINFQSFISKEDYKLLEQYEKEIAELEKLVKKNYWVVEFPHGWYLTSNELLCLCKDPTRFSTKREAKEYLDRAIMDDTSKLSAKIIHIKGDTNGQ